MPKLVKIAEMKDLPPGTSKDVQVDGCNIAVFNVAGTCHAIDNICPHAGGPLAEGELAGDVVTCTWHNAKFNVKTGEVLRPPARKGVRSFPVKIDGNDVLVELD